MEQYRCRYEHENNLSHRICMKKQHSSLHEVQTTSSQLPASLVADNALLDKIGHEMRTGRPSRLLLTLLADYWWQQNELLPSAALVALLSEFGISDTSARAVLSRLIHHGLLNASKHGRQTFYGLNEQTWHILEDGARRIFSFGQHLRSWNGFWSFVAFSIPETNRQLRHVLRDRLRWLGFAPLYDGLWVSPRDNLSDVASQLAQLSISTTTMFQGRIMDATPEAGLPLRAWDLDALRAQYQQFINDIEPVSLCFKKGMLSPEEALQVRTRIVNAWLNFPAMDPDLPDELLPADWPRRKARELFVTMYDELGPLALFRIQQIIVRHAPALARKATYHSSDLTTW